MPITRAGWLHHDDQPSRRQNNPIPNSGIRIFMAVSTAQPSPFAKNHWFDSQNGVVLDEAGLIC